jgi:hypothetical protein
MNVIEELMHTLQQELRDSLFETSKQVYQSKLAEYADLYKQQLPGLIRPLFEKMNLTVEQTVRGGGEVAAVAASAPAAAPAPAQATTSLMPLLGETAAVGLGQSIVNTLMHSITKKLDSMILESFESDFKLFRAKFTEGSELEDALLAFAKEHISTNFLLLMGARREGSSLPSQQPSTGGRRSRRRQRMYQTFFRHRRPRI